MQRFWDKVDKSGDCWLWTASKRNGYGGFAANGKMVRAHRFVIELEGSDIPSGMFVCHTCDNKLCVNPDHLFIASHDENMRDMVSKNRQTLGQKNGNAKLTEEDVRGIMADNRSYGTIAKQYNTCKSNVTSIKNGKTWAHVHTKQGHL